jgi:hypothetical protein
MCAAPAGHTTVQLQTGPSTGPMATTPMAKVETIVSMRADSQQPCKLRLEQLQHHTMWSNPNWSRAGGGGGANAAAAVAAMATAAEECDCCGQLASYFLSFTRSEETNKPTTYWSVAERRACDKLNTTPAASIECDEPLKKPTQLKPKRVVDNGSGGSSGWRQRRWRRRRRGIAGQALHGRDLQDTG